MAEAPKISTEKPDVTVTGKDSATVAYSDGVKAKVDQGHVTNVTVDMGGGKGIYSGDGGFGVSYEFGHKNKPGEKKLTMGEAIRLLGAHSNTEALGAAEDALNHGKPKNNPLKEFIPQKVTLPAANKEGGKDPFTFSFGGPTPAQQQESKRQIEASHVRSAEAGIKYGWLTHNSQLSPVEAYERTLKQVENGNETRIAKAEAKIIVATAVQNLKATELNNNETFQEFAALAEAKMGTSRGSVIQVDHHFSGFNGGTVGKANTSGDAMPKPEGKGK